MRAHGWVALVLILTAAVTGYLVYGYEPQSKRPQPTRLSIEEVYGAAPDRQPEQPALPPSYSERYASDWPSVAGPSSTANPFRAAIDADRSRLGELPRPVPRPPGPNPFRVSERVSATSVQLPCSSSSQKALTTIDAQPVVIFTGVVRTRLGKERIAPLEIRTSSGSDYFIKLCDLADNQEELAMYVEGGRTFTTDVPLGTYKLRYAAGNVWYGEHYRFGPDTVYYEADKHFTFYRQGNSVNGYTIELILQVDGNLRTRRLDPAQF
jgi:hypothetical protein